MVVSFACTPPSVVCRERSGNWPSSYIILQSEKIKKKMRLIQTLAVVASAIALLAGQIDASLELPNGGRWGIKDAYKGTMKIGISALGNRLLRKNDVCALYIHCSPQRRTHNCDSGTSTGAGPCK